MVHVLVKCQEAEEDGLNFESGNAWQLLYGVRIPSYGRTTLNLFAPGLTLAKATPSKNSCGGCIEFL